MISAERLQNEAEIISAYPFTYAPALDERKMQAPATSSGLPMRPRGTPPTMESRAAASVAAIILDSKGPQARVLLVIPRRPSWDAKTRLS